MKNALDHAPDGASRPASRILKGAAFGRAPFCLARRLMSDWEDKVNQHASELVRLTRSAADLPDPRPEDELARLGKLIAIERQLLIDTMTMVLHDDDPEAAALPGVAEFDAGFLYGLAFARALDDARQELDRVRRGRILKLVRRGLDDT
jgi:hypothetical protein